MQHLWEESMGKPITRPVNKPFYFTQGICLKPVAVEVPEDERKCCEGCYFTKTIKSCWNPKWLAITGSCACWDRADHKDVIFVKVERKVCLK